MAQVLEFKLPDLGEGLTEAEITRWLVRVGDVVEVDQPVVEVETAKAMVEVPCPYGGVVTARFGEEGTELPVGAPLLTVAVGASVADLESGAADSGTRAGASADGASDAGGAPQAGGAPEGGRDEASGNVLVGYGTAAAPARRRRVRPAREGASAAAGQSGGSGADTASGAGAGAGSGAGSADAGVGLRAASRAEGSAATVTAGAADTAAAAETGAGPGPGAAPAHGDGPVPVISPLVRKLARENGVDLRELVGSGPDGLILRADVEYAMRASAAVAPVAGPASASAAARAVASGIGATFGSPGTGVAEGAAARAQTPADARGAVGGARSAAVSGSGTRIPLRGVRGAVADKLARSRREIPDATCWVDADATELMVARRAMNAAGGPKVSLLSLLARVCTAALARYPELNSTVDMEAREIVRLDEVHLGFAAQTDRGLVVPVVKGAHARDTESLSAELARLSDAARTGTLTPGELTGSTFTLNNYGVFGVDGSTPIINHPEAAMLGVGRIVPKPWVHQGELAVRQVVQLSLTFDHRVCDGGTAGGFLRFVADCVEQPAVLLRSV
ncbi:branched-chain alpha-keto acid dehydrogenase subunit E2 [Streptomyces alboflavus]|uniref:Dihydrolipoamide acetyltransferase component of pyruvate dehydrogenase complex n=1 Tax=Streptomyces alboflavus TaxID=67267 RepID=A0A1Z1WF80_9ACTN|nr:dihydrolipoamide acetyltransferase family protein [Streptomyces alboflavus]ARX85000.1 branched-chain alpha-keto acid dehydrogenase subunit E2 [Streptomyces alboflavus]